ncbi:MAG: hypothetical protein JSW59_13660, partial [Phycisphaerales bacterium]
MKKNPGNLSAERRSDTIALQQMDSQGRLGPEAQAAYGLNAKQLPNNRRRPIMNESNQKNTSRREFLKNT